MGIKAEDLQEVVGEFSATSKHTGSSYGCKGEALAAISAISKVEIVSKERGAAECYFKRLHGSDRLTHRSSRGPQGTTVTVNDIFHNIPVRRKCIRPSSELPRVKEIVRKMAVLHYRVSFVLYDHGGRKIVLNIPQDISISPRVVRLHSAAVLSSMTVSVCVIFFIGVVSRHAFCAHCRPATAPRRSTASRASSATPLSTAAARLRIVNTCMSITGEILYVKLCLLYI